jgi:uncharacterized flavoprotein (TIGR03862 family)
MTDTAPRTRAVAVVGGGPAGLMAAEVLARGGADVTVFERMPTVGRKLQVAGRGGLNLTHSEPLLSFLGRYGTARGRLAPAIAAFGPDALRAWSEELGEGTFVGSSGRVFPEGFRATALLRAWLRRLADLGVDVRTRQRWTGWDELGRLTFTDAAGAIVAFAADACILALGGASWPRTGSDGAWVPRLAGLGVDIVPLGPANCGFVVDWSDEAHDRFAGAPVKDVVLRHDGTTARGDIVVTKDGVEGGPIYALGAALRATIERDGHAVVEIDLRPSASEANLALRFQRRRPKDSVSTGLRRIGLAPVAIHLLRQATGNQLPTDADALTALLRAVPLRLERPQPIERAISTSGGVRFEALDSQLMLRGRPGTFVAGEMLDWEAPTGGYLLQGAFSTGAAAGRGALAWLDTSSH